MPASLCELILQQIPHAAQLYHRLLVVAGPSGSGKTSALRDVSQRLTFPLVNVNMEMSKAMLELSLRQRSLEGAGLLEDLVAAQQKDTVLLDNTELLFETTLRQDPLRLLQGLSRNRTIIVAWNGTVTDGFLTYAAPEHPEFRRYPARDLLIVTPQTNTAI